MRAPPAGRANATASDPAVWSGAVRKTGRLSLTRVLITSSFGRDRPSVARAYTTVYLAVVGRTAHVGGGARQQGRGQQQRVACG